MLSRNQIMNNIFDWTGNEFTVEELNGKNVEFSVVDERHQVLCGTGILLSKMEGGAMRVGILSQRSGVTSDGAIIGNRQIMGIPGSEARKLMRNPAGSPCEFSFHSNRV